MAKKKDSMALFEVIAKNRPAQRETGLNVPGWMKPGDAPEASTAEPAKPAKPVRPAPPVMGEPLVAVEGRRLRLSLNYVTCVAAGVAVVVLLAIAFMLGRATAGPQAAEAPQASPAASPSADAGGEQAATPLAFPADVPRVAGKYYLVVQGMRGMGDEHRKAAEDIVAYLQGEGVPADVGTYSAEPKQYVVWSLTGFDTQDSAEALGYVGYIEELGQRYMARGGKYDFKHRDREGKLKPWFQRAAS